MFLASIRLSIADARGVCPAKIRFAGNTGRLNKIPFEFHSFFTSSSCILLGSVYNNVCKKVEMKEFEMRTLLSLSVAVLAGLLMTRVAKPLKLPSVTAYLVAGVLIGPYCLGLLGIEGLGFPTQESVDSLSLISEVALGFIAFSIGSEFRLSEPQKNRQTGLCHRCSAGAGRNVSG